MGVFTDSLVVEIFPSSDMPFGIYRGFDFHQGRKNSGRFVRCEEGFRWNGTSFPWVIHWLLRPSDPELLQCSALHDKLFRTGCLMTIDTATGKEVYEPIGRLAANSIMAEAMVALKVAKWKQVVVNTGLAAGSGPAWRRAAKKYPGAIRTATTQ